MATYGLRVRDASGNVLVDISTRILRLVGTVQTGTTNGSITVPDDASGTVFFMLTGQDRSVTNSGYAEIPKVTLSGRTISWTFSGSTTPSSGRISSLIVYGVHS